MTTAEQLMQRGRAQIQLTQLEQRFGPLPDATIAPVEHSTPAELDRLARTALTRPTLTAVFAD